MTQTTITVYEFGNAPHLAIEGWDFESPALDYASPRAQALYEALGVDLSDEEYALAVKDGRWGLFGMTVEGHPFAVEGKLKL